MYAHFACGFVKDGIVHARTEEMLRGLAARNGWFVPVSTLLDFLRVERSAASIPAPEIASMEHQWAIDKAVLLAGRVFHRKMWDYQSDLLGKTGNVYPPVQTKSGGRYHDPMQPLL